MILRIPVIVLVSLLSAGCASVEGTYLPDCPAYSGSKIELADGRFRWSKFTDQVVLDDDGNEVNQFPGFPREGEYALSGNVVTLATEPAETLYLLEESGATYLLTAREKMAMEGGAARPECALRRQSPGT